MSKLLRMWNASSTACGAVSDGNADCENATARTKRDGGVKSPGRPRKPEPCPNCASLMPPRFTGGTLSTVRLTYLRRLVICQSNVGELVTTPCGLSDIF